MLQWYSHFDNWIDSDALAGSNASATSDYLAGLLVASVGSDDLMGSKHQVGFANSVGLAGLVDLVGIVGLAGLFGLAGSFGSAVFVGLAGLDAFAGSDAKSGWHEKAGFNVGSPTDVIWSWTNNSPKNFAFPRGVIYILKSSTS